jgi:hypothetical protein
MGRPSQISAHEVRLLRDLWMAGCPVKEIMRHIPLTENAIKDRAHRAGWPPLKKIRMGRMNELENQERLDRSAAEARGMTLPEYYRDLARRVASKDARVSLERTRIAASDPVIGYPIVAAEDFPEDYEG